MAYNNFSINRQQKEDKERENKITIDMGKLLKEVRERIDVTVDSIAKKKIINRSTIYNIENGIAFPADTTLQKLLDEYSFLMTKEELSDIKNWHNEIKSIRLARKNENKKQTLGWRG